MVARVNSWFVRQALSKDGAKEGLIKWITDEGLTSPLFDMDTSQRQATTTSLSQFI